MTDRVTGRTYPTIEIAGKEYTLRPIPATMAFDLADVIEVGFGAMLRMSRQGDGQIEPTAVMQIITALLRKNRTMFLDLFAHVLGVKKEEFNNGERFPLNTFIVLSKALGEHPDVQDFLSEIQGAMDSLPDVQEEESPTTTDETPSPDPSEPSESTEVIRDGATSDS